MRNKSRQEWLESVMTIFRQFRLPMALRLLVFEAVRKVVNPYEIPSYAQTGEDRVIDYYVGYPECGFYVDVGCNDPVFGSNTFRLYRRGWHGLCIDINESCIRRFKKVRPRDIAVAAAVSDVVRDVLYTEFLDSRVSSISSSFVTELRNKNPVAPVRCEKQIRTVTLTDLCQRYSVTSRFELLSVDCEGHDLEVLRSLNFSMYRPRIIVVEILHFRMETIDTDPICGFLKEKGYHLQAYATQNAYFRDGEPCP